MSDTLAFHAPPADLDMPAARLAARHYDTARARGVPNQQAWEEAVSIFAGHHPSWPMPLVEQEAYRWVSALLNRQRSEMERPIKSARKLSLDLLVDLATPETAESMRATMRVEAMGAGAVSIFRGAWKLAGNLRPVSARLPLGRQAENEAMLHALRHEGAPHQVQA